MQHILSQQFHFLNEALQTWVWESANGAHVLKLFKDFAAGREQYRKWGKDPDDLQQSWFDNAIQSYRLAFECLRKETALVYLHLTDGPAPVDVLRLGDDERDASYTHFLVQEKVELVRDRLCVHMKNGDMRAAERTIDDVLQLVASIWRKDITEDTFNFDHNYGYTADGRIVQIDVGSFWQGKDAVRKQLAEQKLTTSNSAIWLRDIYPELHLYYAQAVARLYKRGSL